MQGLTEPGHLLIHSGLVDSSQSSPISTSTAAGAGHADIQGILQGRAERAVTEEEVQRIENELWSANLPAAVQARIIIRVRPCVRNFPCIAATFRALLQRVEIICRVFEGRDDLHGCFSHRRQNTHANPVLEPVCRHAQQKSAMEDGPYSIGSLCELDCKMSCMLGITDRRAARRGCLRPERRFVSYPCPNSSQKKKTN